ncbi:hypothetical protein V2J09_021590 [Rumex salicifolius]
MTAHICVKSVANVLVEQSEHVDSALISTICQEMVRLSKEKAKERAILLTLQRLLDQDGCLAIFSSKDCVFQDSTTKQVRVKGQRMCDLYKIKQHAWNDLHLVLLVEDCDVFTLNNSAHPPSSSPVVDPVVDPLLSLVDTSVDQASRQWNIELTKLLLKLDTKLVDCKEDNFPLPNDLKLSIDHGELLEDPEISYF